MMTDFVIGLLIILGLILLIHHFFNRPTFSEVAPVKRVSLPYRPSATMGSNTFTAPGYDTKALCATSADCNQSVPF